MYNANSLEYTIDRLFRGGVGEHGYRKQEVDEMLEVMDYDALLQAVRHNAQTVYAYAAQGEAPKSFNYRGSDLFGQRATLLYDDYDQSSAVHVRTGRHYELWLLEDMSIELAVCVSVKFGDGEYVTAYREVKSDDPWDSALCLDLEKLSKRLLGMCALHYKGCIPVYEL